MLAHVLRQIREEIENGQGGNGISVAKFWKGYERLRAVATDEV